MKKNKVAKSWQRCCVEELKGARFGSNHSPGGSGKSLTQCMLGALDMETTGNKQLILVPQNHIHNGFNEVAFRLKGGGKVRTWRVGHNFCLGKDGKLAALQDWLLSDAKDMEGPEKAAIATHMAMVMVWRTLTPKQMAKAIRSTTFRIDEAHHIKGVVDEVDGQEEPEEFRNFLGEFVQYLVDADKPDSKLHLTTATAYRGDRLAMFAETLWDKFKVFRLDWDEYYATLGLEDCQIDFIPYESDPLALIINAIRAEPNNRHLVIVPPLGKGFRTDATMGTLLKSLYQVVDQNDVLDLVATETQDVNKRRLLSDPDSLRVVVACRLFDEGTDWPICDRMHNTDACEKSMTLAIQRFYRPFRYHPAKRTVKINNYVPAFDENLSKDERRRCLSNRFNGTLACIVTSGELLPIKVPVPEEQGEGSGKERRKSLQELYGHEVYIEIVQLLTVGYERLPDKTDSDAAEKLVRRTLKTVGVPKDVDPADMELAMQKLLVRIANPDARRIGKDDFQSSEFAGAIARLGFDKVWPKVAGRTNLIYGTENVSVNTIRELVRLIHRPLSRDQIDDGIREFFARTQQRPTFATGWIKELETTSSAVEKQLRRNFKTTLAQEVDSVLGNGIAGLLEQCRSVIRAYADRGIRLGNKYGDIPEMGMTSFALNGRLTTHHGTTLAAEVEKLLGPLAAPLDLENVKSVVRQYFQQGKRLHRKFGPIPELRMTSFNLHDRLLRTYGIKLSKIVAECA